MAEATPEEGTSLLSTHDAVELLLNFDAPKEEEKAVESEEASVSEVAAEEPEAEEAEVEAEAEEFESEDIEVDEAEDEEEAEEAQEESQPTYRVQAGEEEVEVTLDELRNSYMRQADYTRKTQQVAEDRKAVATELENLSGERQRYADQLAMLDGMLSQRERTQEYWDKLKASNPAQYAQELEADRQRETALNNVRAEQQRVQQERLAELQSKAQQRFEQEQAKLPELIPEWSDPQVAQKEKTALVTYLQTFGYTPEELANASDSRAIALSRKAYLYDQLMEKKPATQKRTAKAPKMTKSGQPTSKKQASRSRRQKAFSQIGKHKGRKAMDAAVNYLLEK